MGRKGKPEELGLTEFIIEKWDGGKNTIVYVTEEVAKRIEEKGCHITISRESVRRVIKSHQEEIEDARKAVDAAKAMAEVLKDYPATEASEATLMQLSHLIAQDIRQFESIEFDNPVDAVNAASKIANAQLKMSQYRTKAVAALDKAKKALKDEIRTAIQSDPELLNRLIEIIDKAKVAA
jgi:uncharacterized protein YdcH (DUF465 family)